MDNASRTFSDREVQAHGDTASEAIAVFDADFEKRQPIVTLESARQARTNNDLYRWVSSVLPAIDEFLRLPDGWDTYKAKPLKLDTGMFALQLLYQVMNPRMPVPLVAPTTIGGVQFEWHQGPLDIELSINAPYDCDLTFVDRDTGKEGSYRLTSDFSQLTRLILRLQSVRRVA